MIPRFGDCFEKGEEGRRPQPALGKRTDSERSHCWKPAEADCAICRPFPWLSCAILQLASRLPGAAPSFSSLKAGSDVSWQNEPFLPYSLVSPSCISRPRWDLEAVRRKGSWVWEGPEGTVKRKAALTLPGLTTHRVGKTLLYFEERRSAKETCFYLQPRPPLPFGPFL